MSAPQIIVQKYGGATVSDPKKIIQIAEQISKLLKKGIHPVVVVSAMGKTTNQLIELANQISPNPNRRELDMLLSTGERVSMALLSMALNDLGCEAISFTGSQAGILTSASHLNAFIQDVKAPRITEALQKNKIVVLAGFQGVSPATKEVTTLGRGGSDITAIAIATALRASRCEILKDVDAVFTADPKIIPNATPLSKLTYDQLMEMTFWGAKVLHYRSAELAKRNLVPLYIGPATNNDESGTLITKGESMFESNSILALNSHEIVMEIETDISTYSAALKNLEEFFTEKEISSPQVLACLQEEKLRLLLTGPNEITLAIQKEIPSSKKFKLNSQIFSAVAATCTGSTSSEIPKMICEKLENAGIKIKHLLFSPMSVVAVVPIAQRTKAIEALHELI